MKWNTIFLIVCTMLGIFLIGCWNARELNELGISLVMGLDEEGDDILLTAEVVDPSFTQKDGGSVGQGGPVKYVQGTGCNVFEAFRDVVLKFDRRLFVSHNKVVIIGEDLAKNGVAEHIDELFRDREQRETAHVLIAKGAKAYEVMGISSGLESIPANYISNLIKNIKENPKAMDMNMIENLKHFYHEGHQSIMGVIEKRGIGQIDKMVEETDIQDYELSIIGSAIFDEGSLVGYLNGNDTKALNFIMDRIEGGIITFPTPDSALGSKSEFSSKHRELSSVVIINSKTKNDVKIKDGNVVLSTKIRLRGSIGEVVGNIDISKEENLKQMEKACSKSIEEGIKTAITKVQKQFGLDVFGYGLVFHRKYPKKWMGIKENWDQVFSKADFEVEVKTDIIRTGLINTPVIRKKER